jgi:hypothetical protein
MTEDDITISEEITEETYQETKQDVFDEIDGADMAFVVTASEHDDESVAMAVARLTKPGLDDDTKFGLLWSIGETIEDEKPPVPPTGGGDDGELDGLMAALEAAIGAPDDVPDDADGHDADGGDNPYFR